MYDEKTPVVLELMGKTQAAGWFQKTDNPDIWRLTLPTQPHEEDRHKDFTTQAIFAITPVTEEQMRVAAINIDFKPVLPWILREGVAVDIYDDDGYDDDYRSDWDDDDMDEFGPDEDDDYPDGESGDDDGTPELVPIF